MIDLADSRKLSEIAADFEGCEAIKKTDDAKAAYEMFEGFTRLLSIRRSEADDTVRITLAAP